MNKIQISFGHKLRELREEKSLTQEQLAEKIGVSTNAVGQFERGKIFPNYETITTIINVLDVDANLFFSRDAIDYPDEAKWIAKIIVKLTPEERKNFGKVLEGLAKIFLLPDDTGR